MRSTIIGFRRNGRPIYLIQGGSVDAAAGTGQQQTDDNKTGEKTGDTGGQQQTGQQVGKPGEGGPEMFSRDYVEKLRASEAGFRVRANEAETARKAEADRVAAILKAAGIGNEVDPVKAAEEANARTAQLEAKLTATLRENALGRAARTLNADEDLLTAVLLRDGSLNKLDPSAADFQTSLDDLVKKAIEANPKLKAGQVQGKSGGDFGGGTGETGLITEAQLAKMTPEQVSEALKAGKLRHLL